MILISDSEIQPKDSAVVTLTLTLCVLATLWSYYKIKRARAYLQRIITIQQNMIDKHKIIIAFEIEEFFLKYSTKMKKNYHHLQIQYNGNLFYKTLRKIFGVKHSYKLMFSQKKIQQFVERLSNLRNVELVLYTSLPENATSALLDKIKLDAMIPPNRRRFCNLKSRDGSKHAILVDQYSKRVMILTPSPYDHVYEDEKYFLLTRPRITDLDYLDDLIKQLKVFIQSNENIDSFHEELAIFKIEYESRYQEN